MNTPKKLTRQQKRAVIRTLNDPDKVKKIVTAQQNKHAREIKEFKNGKLRKRALIFLIALGLGLLSLLLFA